MITGEQAANILIYDPIHSEWRADLAIIALSGAYLSTILIDVMITDYNDSTSLPPRMYCRGRLAYVDFYLQKLC